MEQQELGHALTIAGENLEMAYLTGDAELVTQAIEELHEAQRLAISSLSDEQRADLYRRIKEWQEQNG